ncbi:MAG: Na+/H+ antiporter [uncultured Sulfurovum sp.]|uniref:Na+/H+ antiporter n=1 Tax=uncultured Sulfurovum sp. TaxID=269237 RepID=A0A6S6TM88_9BACT|nr:MAG: Na+/H+ antiporter [uncultured Sulfurovum sp.]
MILTLLALLTILFIAIELQKYFKIPSPVSLIGLSYGFYYMFPQMVLFSEETFADLVLFLIPILIAADALQLKLEDLRKNALSLFYVAAFSVAISISFGIIAANTFFAEYALSTGAIIALFAMVLATDPVSVVSVFSSFKVPHKLAILAEGESLFNDATALIIFMFIAIPMINGVQIGAMDIALVSLKVILFSVLIGLFVGYVGILLMRLTSDAMSELVLILLTAYGAFEIAEIFHFAGLLAVIVAIITLNTITQKSFDEKARQVKKSSSIVNRANRNKKIFSTSFMSGITRRLSNDVSSIERHKQNLNYVGVLALLANTFLFMSMASIVHIDELLAYKTEILLMFLITTLIRAFMMGTFGIVSNLTQKMTNIGVRWWSVLLFAGIKGGLSIVMLQMLPKGFEHQAMFEAIVIGVILLSTFVYATVLVGIILLNKNAFDKEVRRERH